MVREAACQEIIRRYIIAQCDYKKGRIEEDVLERAKLLMDDMELSVEDRKVVLPAREYAEYKRECDERYANVVVMAMEMEDGTIINWQKLQAYGGGRGGHTQLHKVSQRHG